MIAENIALIVLAWTGSKLWKYLAGVANRFDE